ncbi:hypothetical protein [Ornithinimicrobium cryptoxanthini]|uniref:Uncharacterized protein n=1 Tax=Ornithinimicrobium cryptoxanthini TaxID=2934161 RepID=A0ABY4YHR1_9MICO|nr:hypothetical protein [Ornithinimicrobium cryptoxanthini]USQ76330.1 hypothetical protein NF557_17365 [Ornithinimicrobium cryptoxanthini]
MGDLSTPAQVSPPRRWIADPLALLGLLALGSVGLGALQLSGTPVTWPVPALLAVVAAGLALSGST